VLVVLLVPVALLVAIDAALPVVVAGAPTSTTVARWAL
jgi:hypothetical protein